MSGRLQGKVAVVTGAAQGIGRVTARIFMQQGAKVALIDKDAARVKEAAEALRAEGGETISFGCDISDKKGVTAAIDETAAKFGGLHVLVNNAGVTLTRPFIDTTDEDIDFLVNVNLKGTIFASQAAIPHLARAGGGAIVHDASNAGLVGRPWQPVYGATKAGIISLTKAMALAHAKDKVRVNCICPGSIDTPMLRGALTASGDFEGNWKKTGMVIPLGYIGKPEDIAYATLFLASDEAAYITGIALPVDGGRTAGVAETSLIGMAVPK